MALWKGCIGILAVASGVIACSILGFMAGTYIGGNYVQNFTFIGSRGYEAADLMGLILGGITGGPLNLRLVLTNFVVSGDFHGNLEKTNASSHNE